MSELSMVIFIDPIVLPEIMNELAFHLHIAFFPYFVRRWYCFNNQQDVNIDIFMFHVVAWLL